MMSQHQQIYVLNHIQPASFGGSSMIINTTEIKYSSTQSKRDENSICHLSLRAPLGLQRVYNLSCMAIFSDIAYGSMLFISRGLDYCTVRKIQLIVQFNTSTGVFNNFLPCSRNWQIPQRLIDQIRYLIKLCHHSTPLPVQWLLCYVNFQWIIRQCHQRTSERIQNLIYLGCSYIISYKSGHNTILPVQRLLSWNSRWKSIFVKHNLFIEYKRDRNSVGRSLLADIVSTKYW